VSEQINLRLEDELVAALERVAREESLDRGTVIRRLLAKAIEDWQIENALGRYQRGEVSIGRASEDSALSQWELLDLIRSHGIAYPLRAEHVEERLRDVEALLETEDVVAERLTDVTLPDVPPQPGAVLLIGINPAPISVAAGHYYQGRLGRRLWKRLERIGLLRDATPGSEDEAFARAGHGLTDIAKRPTRSARELSRSELQSGVSVLREKVRSWKPGLLLFPFKEPARLLLGESVHPGAGPPFEGSETFLLSGPYASRAVADETDHELRTVLARLRRSQESTDEHGRPENATDEHSQPLTANDLARGQIRLPRRAKAMLPATKTEVEVLLRGTKVPAQYDPRTGPDRERSAVLRVGHDLLGARVKIGETLRLSRGLAGLIRLD